MWKSYSSHFGSSVIAGHGLPPVTAVIEVWLDGVGQAGMYGTVEWMNGRRLHRCRQGIPINNGTRIEVLVRISSRGQNTKCVAISWSGGLRRTTKRWGGNTSQTVKTVELLNMSDKRLFLLRSERVCQPSWEMREDTGVVVSSLTLIVVGPSVYPWQMGRI